MSQKKFTNARYSWLREDAGAGTTESPALRRDDDESFDDAALEIASTPDIASIHKQEIINIARKIVAGEQTSADERKKCSVLPVSCLDAGVQAAISKYSKHILMIQDDDGKQYIVLRGTSYSIYKPIPKPLLEALKDAVHDRELIPLPSQLAANFGQLRPSKRKEKLTQSFGMNFGRKYYRERASELLDLLDKNPNLFETLNANYKSFNNLGEDYIVFIELPPPDIHASFPNFDESSLARIAGFSVGEKSFLSTEQNKTQDAALHAKKTVSKSHGVPKLPQSNATSVNDSSPFLAKSHTDDGNMYADLFELGLNHDNGGDFLTATNLDEMPLYNILARFVNDDAARTHIQELISAKDACINKLQGQSEIDAFKIENLERDNRCLQNTIDERNGEVLQLHSTMKELRTAPPAWQQEKDDLNSRVLELEGQVVRFENLLPFAQLAQPQIAESPRRRIESLEQEKTALESKVTNFEQALLFEEQDHRQTKEDKDLALRQLAFEKQDHLQTKEDKDMALRQLAFEKDALELQVYELTTALELENGNHGETMALADRYQHDAHAAIAAANFAVSKIARLEEAIETWQHSGNATVMGNVILDMYRRNDELEGKIVHLRTCLGIPFMKSFHPLPPNSVPGTTASRPFHPNSLTGTPQNIHSNSFVHSPRTPFHGRNNLARYQGAPYTA